MNIVYLLLLVCLVKGIQILRTDSQNDSHSQNESHFHNDSHSQNESDSDSRFLHSVWAALQYNSDNAIPCQSTDVYSELQWKQAYEAFFFTPAWLTQQKFSQCDWNQDQLIIGQEIKCF